MKALNFFIILFVFKSFGQDIIEINKNLNIKNELEFNQEIRIYKDYSITNNVVIFRMFYEGNNEWKAEIFYYLKNSKQCTKIEKIEFPQKEIGDLKPKDANLIWLNLLLCNAEYLPSLVDIDYKLNSKSIQIEDGEEMILTHKISPLDGESYTVYVKNGKKLNHFSFNNLETYLKHYPNVDELISYNQIISIIKKEFNLWND